MSDCGNCDCADKSQCTKKRGFQVEASSEITFGAEVYGSGSVAMENDCKCGPNCNCDSCSCHK